MTSSPPRRRPYQRRSGVKDEGDPKGFYARVKREVARGYRAFCKRRGLDPDDINWKQF